MTSRARSAGIGLCLVAIVATARFASGEDPPLEPRYQIDVKASEVKLEVKKKGALKAFAHDHDMIARTFTGTVVWAPNAIDKSSVALKIATKDIDVLKGELSDKDRQTVQDEMVGPDVLDVAKFPDITFASQSIVALEKDEKGRRPLTVTGQLALHGVSKQHALAVLVEEKPDGSIEIAGEHRFKQTDHGMTPPSFAFGTVGVQDEVIVRFRIVARRQAPAK